MNNPSVMPNPGIPGGEYHPWVSTTWPIHYSDPMKLELLKQAQRFGGGNKEAYRQQLQGNPEGEAVRLARAIEGGIIPGYGNAPTRQELEQEMMRGDEISRGSDAASRQQLSNLFMSERRGGQIGNIESLCDLLTTGAVGNDNYERLLAYCRGNPMNLFVLAGKNPAVTKVPTWRNDVKKIIWTMWGPATAEVYDQIYSFYLQPPVVQAPQQAGARQGQPSMAGSGARVQENQPQITGTMSRAEADQKLKDEQAVEISPNMIMLPGGKYFEVR